eukprot:2718271-Rhodomonas_salina.3
MCLCGPPVPYTTTKCAQAPILYSYARRLRRIRRCGVLTALYAPAPFVGFDAVHGSCTCSNELHAATAICASTISDYNFWYGF